MEKQTIFCPNCGQANPLSVKFCSQCGANLTETISEFKAQHQKETASPEDRYQAALQAFSDGKLDQAEELFSKLDSYQDAPAKLKLVQKAKQTTALQRKDAHYRQTLAQAQGATTTATLRSYLTELERLAGGQNDSDRQAQVQALQTKYQQMVAAEKERQKRQQHQAKIVGIIVLIVLTLSLGGYFLYQHQQTAQADLHDRVSSQRADNAASFKHLDRKTRASLATMMQTYHANKYDYIYTVKQKTADYTVIAYRFLGPDDHKDVLPKKGMRVYQGVALYRK